ncbi:MAG: germination protein YpeB [Oscillospiraceae bacterium]|nr:germination protein YpeB [Oscillospiraceae bacterium]
MSRRLLVRAISYVIVAFIISFVLSLQNLKRAKRYEDVISNNYYYALSELMSGVTKIDYALEKCAYSSDDLMIATLCAEIFREADVSGRALSMLPVRELSLEYTTKFISQTGDYAYYLTKKASRGEKITEKEREQLMSLAGGTARLMGEVRKASGRINDEEIDLATIDFSDGEDMTVGDIKKLEREFSEYPVLVYDGPFSDETDGERELLKKVDVVSEMEIKNKIVKFLSVQDETVSFSGERNEDGVELMSFTAGEYSVDATKRGGILMRVISDRSADTAKLSTEKALLKANQILDENGFLGFRETYHIKSDNLLTVNFAKHIGKTVIYPELIKITISLEDGSVVNFDSAGFIKNYKERIIEDVSGTADAARGKLSSELSVLAYSPAIIPTDGTGETLSHEFTCKTKDEKHCLVYINPKTLREDRILILLEDESGTLVM